MVTESQVNYGFIPDVITEDNYILGASPVPEIVLQENGDWTPFVPVKEVQRNGFETYNCTAYGSLNAIEILIKRQFNKNVNYSDRAVGIVADTKPPGNSPHKVLEVIRKVPCMIPDYLLSFKEEIPNVIEYYAPKPLPQMFQRMGQEWLDTYYFKHEWVFNEVDLKEKQERLLTALKYSPVCVSVYAWKDKNGVYYKDKEKDNHWVVLINGVKNKHWEIFDSYDLSLKVLDWNYDFTQAKRFHLELLPPLQGWSKVWRWFRNYLSYFN